MALSHSDLLRLLESLRSADGLELLRGIAERPLQELIEAEATSHIGAGWIEHTETRTALRNGHRDKTLTTQAGDLELAIPKLRAGSFFPSLLERRRRIDQALYAVIIETYVHGVSTRAVDDLAKALGADTGISKSEVSRICADLDEPRRGLPPPYPGRAQSYSVRPGCPSLPGLPRPRTPALRAHAAAV